MTNEIAKVDGKAVMAGSMEWTREQVELIKITVARNTSDSQLKLFLYTCKKTGLDPLAKQIHCIVRQTNKGPVMSIQTAIDGYRLVADRSGKYAGNDDPIYDNEDTPRKASVTVYKMVGSQRCGFTATARWSQYFPGEAQGFMWKKMPHLMLGKCAEALALRKAFPAELSGLYTNEEMQQAEVVTAKVIPQVDTSKVAATLSNDELQAKTEAARKRKAELEAEEANKPKEAPVSPVEPAKPSDDGLAPEPAELVADGLINAVIKSPKSSYVKFTVKGYENKFFSTNNPITLEKLEKAKEDGSQVHIVYTETKNGRWVNQNITSAEVKPASNDILDEPAF